jgi:hypothetical protein
MINDWLYKGMKEVHLPVLEGIIDDFAGIIDDEFMFDYGENWVEQPYNLIFIYNNFTSAVTKTDTNGVWQVFYMDSMLFEDQTQAVINTTMEIPYVGMDDSTVFQRYCVNNNVFTAAMNIDSLAGNRRDFVNLTEWNLQGLMAEIFDIYPNLQNYYSPNENYTIARTIAADTDFVENMTGVINMTKEYDFICSRTNQTVLTIYAHFIATLNAEYDEFSPAPLNSYLTDVSINTLCSPQSLDISGKQNARNLLMNELTSISNDPYILPGDGIEMFPIIGQGGIEKRKRLLIPNPGSYCVEF